MASRSGTANGANRDVERAYESGRRAIRCGPGRRACLRIGTACVLRIGTTSDTVRARTASERSGRRAKRYEARFVCDTVRDFVRAYGSGRRACVRIGTTSDTVRARTASERSGRRSICGADAIGACERCGSEPRASVTERALRALLDEFTASARPAATRTSTAGYV